MPKICYIERRFHGASQTVLDKANMILEQYEQQGYVMTLRQLFYRFIATDSFPTSWVDDAYNLKNGHAKGTKNTIKNYKRLGALMNDARLAGVVDWNHLEDRTRGLHGGFYFDDPASAICTIAEQYRIDKWANQLHRIEVWVEKDALLGVFERACTAAEIDVPYFSCRGYNSQSEMWRASERIKSHESVGQKVLILQFSDHDPSGLDMYADIQGRLNIFGCDAEVKRLALTIAQVKHYDPPSNPARETDSRFKEYQKTYGDESWELDALEPTVLVDLIKRVIISMKNQDEWDLSVRKENREKKQLLNVVKCWDNVVKVLK